MSDALRALNDVLRDHNQSWSPDDRALVARIIERGAEIAAGVVAQASVDRELEQWRSQVASVAGAEAHVAASVIQRSIMSLFESATAGLVRGLLA